MKICILSDLHSEFGLPKQQFPASDVTVFAGDIGLGFGGLRWIEKNRPKGELIYVLGNHEYYRHAIPKLTEDLKRQASKSGIHVLENDLIEICGVRFFGCTLWTDFDLFGNRRIAAAKAEETMNDYHQVRLSPASYRRLRPADTTQMHQKSRAWLEHMASEGRTEGGVIITHHAPSSASLNPFYEHDIVSAAYASNMDELVEKSRASLWAHGHTHFCADYKINRTRIVSNQRGYHDGCVEGFRMDFMIEI